MSRVGEETVGARFFDDQATVHHGDPIRDVSDDAQVVADPDDGHVVGGAEVLDEVEDLGLDGHVESRRGLIGH